MKKFGILILSAVLLFTVSANAQSVVKKEYLSQNHKGMIEGANNNSGRTLYYEWVYDSTSTVSYKWDQAGSTKGKVYYTLNLYGDLGQTKKIISLPVQMRNLITTFYVDIIFTKDKMPKGAALIFKKDVKWARLKFVPHKGCAIEGGKWTRKDQIGSFEELMEYCIRQIDSNVDIDCYKSN